MEQHTDLLSVARKVRVAGKELKKRRDRNAKVHGITSNQADALTFIRDNPGCSITVLRAASAHPIRRPAASPTGSWRKGLWNSAPPTMPE